MITFFILSIRLYLSPTTVVLLQSGFTECCWFLATIYFVKVFFHGQFGGCWNRDGWKRKFSVGSCWASVFTGTLFSLKISCWIMTIWWNKFYFNVFAAKINFKFTYYQWYTKTQKSFIPAPFLQQLQWASCGDCTCFIWKRQLILTAPGERRGTQRRQFPQILWNAILGYLECL